MKATCPNDANHKEFYTTAHVMQEWRVDDEGDFIELVEELQTDSGPNPDNIWTCADCGAEAHVTY